MLKIAPACIILMLLFGCSNEDINFVKDGVLNGYPNTTLGKALEANFSNTSWGTETARNGSVFVTFSGKITKELHDKAVHRFFWIHGFGNIGVKTTENDEDRNAMRAIDFLMEKSAYKLRTEEVEKKIDAARGLLREDPYSEEARQVFKAAQRDLMIANVKIAEELVEKEFWPVGSPAMFKWVLSHNRTDFELVECTNDSWANLGIRTDTIFDIIYTDKIP